MTSFLKGVSNDYRASIGIFSLTTTAGVKQISNKVVVIALSDNIYMVVTSALWKL